MCADKKKERNSLCAARNQPHRAQHTTHSSNAFLSAVEIHLDFVVAAVVVCDVSIVVTAGGSRLLPLACVCVCVCFSYFLFIASPNSTTTTMISPHIRVNEWIRSRAFFFRFLVNNKSNAAVRHKYFDFREFVYINYSSVPFFFPFISQDFQINRTLTLISKTIQSLGNLVSSRSAQQPCKEEYTGQLYKKFCTEKHVEAVKHFLEVVSTVGANPNENTLLEPVLLKEG